MYVYDCEAVFWQVCQMYLYVMHVLAQASTDAVTTSPKVLPWGVKTSLGASPQRPHSWHPWAGPQAIRPSGTNPRTRFGAPVCTAVHSGSNIHALTVHSTKAILCSSMVLSNENKNSILQRSLVYKVMMAHAHTRTLGLNCIIIKYCYVCFIITIIIIMTVF